MEHLSFCPVCKSTDINYYLSVKDHFLSKELFTISICKSCGFLFTNPRPDSVEIVNYYKSDDYISHGKSKSLFIKTIFNVVRQYSLYKKFRLINNYSTGKYILDIGCGTGVFLSYFQKRGWNTIGIEPAAEPRNYGKDILHVEIEDESFLDTLPVEKFDVITMWHVLEHVSDIDQKISQLKRTLKNDGLLLFALPNSQSWDCKYYKSLWAAWDVPRHLSHFTQSSFLKLMQNHNLKIIKTIPMFFDSFYISLLSEKFSGNSFPILNAIKNGLKSNYVAKKNFNNYSSLIFLVKKNKNI